MPLYTAYKKSCLDGASPDLTTVSVVARLIDTDIHPFNAADVDLADITAGALESSAEVITTPTTTGGVFDGVDVTFTAVPAGPTIEGILVYNDTPPADADKTLIAFFDSGDVTGLPVTPNGGDIDIAWDTGANKIFAL